VLDNRRRSVITMNRKTAQTVYYYIIIDYVLLSYNINLVIRYVKYYSLINKAIIYKYI